MASPCMTVGTMSGASMISLTAADHLFEMRQQPIAHSAPSTTEAALEMVAMRRLCSVEASQSSLVKYRS